MPPQVDSKQVTRLAILQNQPLRAAKQKLCTWFKRAWQTASYSPYTFSTLRFWSVPVIENAKRKGKWNLDYSRNSYKRKKGHQDIARWRDKKVSLPISSWEPRKSPWGAIFRLHKTSLLDGAHCSKHESSYPLSVEIYGILSWEYERLPQSDFYIWNRNWNFGRLQGRHTMFSSMDEAEAEAEITYNTF